MYSHSTVLTSVNKKKQSAVFLIGLLCILISGAFGKPIWIDEVLQFAIAGFDNPIDAWQAFRPTAGVLNVGQTGAYFMADYFLLKFFGASTFWLRFPSYCTAILMLVSVLHLFQLWKVPYRWQLWGVLALFCQPWVMDFVGEARPYMPLAGSVVATLAYYWTPREKRAKSFVRFLGIAGIFTGVLFHPYFSIYWLFSCVFTFVIWVCEKQDWKRRISLRQFLLHSNVWLCVWGVAIYFLLAFQTWLGPWGRPPPFDPLEWLPKQFSVARHLYATHFLFLKKLKIPFAVLFLIVALRRRWRPQFLPVLGLIVGALAISALVSYVSYLRQYWILERQWIASIVLTTIAATAFASHMATVLPQVLRLAWTTGLFVFVIWNAGVIADKRISDMLTWRGTSSEELQNLSSETPPPRSGGEWEKLARANLAKGGPVWPVFKQIFFQ